MNEELDVAIEVHFRSERGVPVELVNSITQQLAWAVRDAEEEELESMFEYFPEWTTVERDAMRYRFDKLDRDRAFVVEYGGRGSLLLFGAAAGFAYWVADKTIGETFKQAWVESDGHTRLKDFLKSRVFRKRDRIADNLPRFRSRLDGADNVSVKKGEGPIPRIVVEVTPDEAVRVPKPSEIATNRARD
jgi:hypothetical protein